MCYPPSGYIIFSLTKLKFYGGQGPDTSAQGSGAGQPKHPYELSLDTHK